jgi:hypothetical protein
MIFVETIPGMGEGRMKNGGGEEGSRRGEFKHDIFDIF